MLIVAAQLIYEVRALFILSSVPSGSCLRYTVWSG